MSKNQNIFRLASTGTFGLAVFAFFALAYPYHIHYQEQMQLFQFGWDYFRDLVRVPGGFADWCSRFLIQFYYYATLGAAIIALMLVAMQRLVWRASSSQGNLAYVLSFLPAVICFLSLLDDNSVLDGAVAINISLVCALIVRKLRNSAFRVVKVICISVFLYFALGSMSLVFGLVAVADELCRKDAPALGKIVLPIAVLAIAVLLPWLCRNSFSYPLNRLYYGIHYHRYHNAIPLMIWLTAIFSVLVVSVCRTGICARAGRIAPVFAGVIVLATAGAGIPAFSDFRKEAVFGYDFMVRMRQWNKLLSVASKDKNPLPMSVECINLALCKTGHLGSDMFRFYQNGPAGLLPEFRNDFLSSIPTAEVYYHLGMINTAQNFFYEAQEGYPDFQKSGRLHKSLAACSIMNEDYEVARKYLNALLRAPFYRAWAKENLEYVNHPEKIASNREYAWLKSVRIKDKDFYFSQEEMDSMLGLLYLENTANIYASEYMLAYCLLTKNLERFVQVIPMVEQNSDARFFQEGFILWYALNHDGPAGLPEFISKKLVNRFSAFVSDLRAQRSEEHMRKNYGDTYWFYYYYRYK